MPFAAKRPLILTALVNIDTISIVVLLENRNNDPDRRTEHTIIAMPEEVSYGTNRLYVGIAAQRLSLPFGAKYNHELLIENACGEKSLRHPITSPELRDLAPYIATFKSVLLHSPMMLSGGTGVKQPIQWGGSLYGHVVVGNINSEELITESFYIGTVKRWDM